MKYILSAIVSVTLLCNATRAQELFVSTEPASNMPAKSIVGKLGAKFLQPSGSGKIDSRISPEIQLGLSKNWMLHAATDFSDMYSPGLAWESARLYVQYRFFSKDAVQKHFRMAAFSKASYSRNSTPFDEINLDGDHSGVQGGVILTQLIHKLAVSSTLSVLQVTSKNETVSISANPNSAFNYTLSAGYLVFPKKYTDYRQTNFNVYAELIGQRSFDKQKFFVDLAPAVQFIFHSRSKLNIGYRFQLDGNMNRMAENSWMISFDTAFLNALRRKR